MTTYYHVTGTEYAEGEPLLPFNALAEMGVEVAWKWNEADEGFDGDVVCVFDAIEDARDFREEYGGAAIVRVDVPDDESDLGLYELPWGGYISPRQTVVEEGYTAFQGGIPAEWLTVIE